MIPLYSARFSKAEEEFLEANLAQPDPVAEHVTDREILSALDEIPSEFRSVVLLVDVEEFAYKRGCRDSLDSDRYRDVMPEPRPGWRIKRQSGISHRILVRPGWPDFLFAHHDRVTLGPTAMRALAKKTGLRREDL